MQPSFISTTVDAKPFATDAQTAPLLAGISTWLSALEGARAREDALEDARPLDDDDDDNNEGGSAYNPKPDSSTDSSSDSDA